MNSGAEQHQTLIIVFAICGYVLAVYFFVAIFVPRIRFRWGYRRSLWPKSDNTRERQQKMGTLSCFGSAISTAAFTSFFVVQSKAILPFLVVGFVTAMIGQIIDLKGGGAWKKY